MPVAPLFAPSPQTAAQLGRRLRELELTPRFVRENTAPYSDLRTPLEPTRRAALLDDPPLMALRLFFCDMPLAAGEAADLLGSQLCQDLLQHGYLQQTDHGVTFPFQLRHAGPLLILADYLGSDADAVMGAGETTAILYRAGRPQKIHSALDLGCGAGTIALLLASDVEHVVGSDINPRAVAMSQANAALNGLANTEFLTGDMYAPVAGRRFDLILSQPPYYPVKDTTLTFLHSGIRGDELARAVIEGLPSHLNQRGQALLFTSWPDAAQRPALPAFQSLELHTNRRELSGTRQSINILRHAPELESWSADFEVPADQWGNLHPSRIDELYAAQQLLHQSDAAILAAPLSPYPSLRTFTEAGVEYAQYPPQSLLGVQPVPQPPREISDRRNQLQKGLLRVCATGVTFPPESVS